MKSFIKEISSIISKALQLLNTIYKSGLSFYCLIQTKTMLNHLLLFSLFSLISLISLISPTTPLNPYTTLNIPQNSTQSQIRKAFKDLSLIYHPDRAHTVQSEKYKNIIEAYEILRDPDRRMWYDITGCGQGSFRRSTKKSQSPFESSQFDHLFDLEDDEFREQRRQYDEGWEIRYYMNKNGKIKVMKVKKLIDFTYEMRLSPLTAKVILAVFLFMVLAYVYSYFGRKEKEM